MSNLLGKNNALSQELLDLIMNFVRKNISGFDSMIALCFGFIHERNPRGQNAAFLILTLSKLSSHQ
jgi:hypothetical protein